MLQTTNSNGFDNLGIAPKLLDILRNNKIVTPTPIQMQSIPSAITGKDLMGIAQTGTGKTFAFGIPMIQRLAQSGGKSRGLVVLPTRELALQVNDSLKKIGGPLGLKTAILIGGEAMGRQLRALKARPHIIIATPGRLIDHIEQKTVNLSSTDILVLDEADRMLDMGFAPQIKKILETIPKKRQTLLFSATMPDSIVKIANSYMMMPLRVEVAPAGSAVNSVSQEIFFLERKDKGPMLKKILDQYNGSVLVFSRTKHGAKKIARDIRNYHVTATEIHSDRSLNQRLDALNGFKLGKYRVLVATDIAARGIDVTGIQLVVNYDLPDHAEDYVHRIGRTGRAKSTGHAISFATHDQRRDVTTIERLIRKTLPVSKTPALENLQKGESDSRPTFTRQNNNRAGRSAGRPSGYQPSGQSANRPTRSASDKRNKRDFGKRKKYSEYERGRKPAPASLKKISSNSSPFYISKKYTSDDE
ncbi:DEAD/DEAH box helicase [bacterium]|nr:MAG: DEAD/DEAH box helicase [bacterium]